MNNEFEIRSGAKDTNINGRIVSGYAIVFNSPSKKMADAFREVIRPGALDGVDFSEVRALYNHDNGKPLGSVKAGSLKVSIDSRGLAYSLEIPDYSYAIDIPKQIVRRDLPGNSFAFRVSPGGERWTRDANGEPLREVTKIAEVREISLVSFPAYAEASVALRSLAAWKLDSTNVAPPVKIPSRSGPVDDWEMALMKERQRLVNLSVRL
jgi:HK97 family phage prohead protease